jgi:hypothetical protein
MAAAIVAEEGARCGVVQPLLQAIFSVWYGYERKDRYKIIWQSSGEERMMKMTNIPNRVNPISYKTPADGGAGRGGNYTIWV